MLKKATSGLLFVLLVLFTVVPSSQAKEYTAELTMEQAYQMALANSKDIKQINYQIARAQEVRDSIAGKAQSIASGAASPAPALISGLVAADIGLGMTNKQKKIMEDQIKFNVMNKYMAVVTAKQNMDYAEKNMEFVNLQRYISSLSHEIGTVSDYEWNKAQNGYEAAKIGVENANVELEKAYLELNALIGLQPKDRPVLIDKPVFQAVTEDIDADHTISRIVSEDPTVWLKEQNVDLSEVQLTLYNWSDPTREPWTAKQIDVDLAKLSAVQLREQLTDSLYSTLKSLEQLEYSYSMKQREVISAQDEYKVQQLKYELGMISKLEFQQAQLTLERVQNELNNLTWQHELLKYSFYNPWTAYTASMSH